MGGINSRVQMEEDRIKELEEKKSIEFIQSKHREMRQKKKKKEPKGITMFPPK